MKSEHCKEKLSPFISRELPPDEQRRVGEHLLVCDECRREHDEIRLGAAFAAKLERADAPPEVWNALRDAIDAPKARPRPWFFLTLAYAAMAVIVIAGLGTIAYFGLRFESEPRVADLNRKFRVETLAGNPAGAREGLGVGDTLVTDSASRARVTVANIGNVELDPNSKLSLVSSGETEHRMSLERGRLSARILAPPRLFVVDTPSAVAVDLGCAYTLDVADNGDSHLHVTSGYVALERNGRDVIVPAGAIAVTKKEGGLGTPYADDASEEFRSILYRIDFENGGGELKRLIAIARKDDSISLWHLLRSVPEPDRATVLDTLTKHVRMPAGATRSGLLKLDQKMLDDLWYQVKIVWYEG